MPRLEPTTVMTLGRIYAGDLEPPLRTSFLNPPPTTPGYPQNLLRQAVMNGLRGVRGVGLGLMSPAGSYPGPMEQAQYAAGDATAAAAESASQTADEPMVPNGGGSFTTMPAQRNYMPGPGWYALATVSSLASIYHGYRRNLPRGPGKALGWGLWWGLMGTIFPLVTVAVGVAQGYGKPRAR